MWSSLKDIVYPTYYRHTPRKTVRYTFPFLIFIAVLSGIAAATSQNASYIRIDTSSAEVQENELFTIDVYAYAHTPVNAVDVVIEYPEEQIAIEGVDTGTSVITLWTEEPYAKNGRIYLRGGVFQRGFLEEHLIATIRARAKSTGLAYINLDTASMVAGDGKGTTVRVEKVSETQSRIYVTPFDGSLQGEARVQIVTDIDGNGSVDITDISAFMAAWFSKGKTFDFNGDGRMTFKDFSILLADSFFR